MNGYERLTASLAGEPTDCLPWMPITMMFAADQLGVPYGRYAADYRTLVEAQLLTADRFGFDHVSAISDPAREAADCAAAIHFFDDQPPAIDEVNALLADKTLLASLRPPDPFAGRMLDRVRAVESFRRQVGRQLLIEGWIEGPCAEAADLRGINRLMTDFFDDPNFVHDLFEFIIEMELRFARAQAEAGADIMGVGDAAASLVGPRVYEQFVLPYEKRLIDGLHAMGLKVRLHICGNIRRILSGIATLGCELVDIDYMVPMTEARQNMPAQLLCGNLDPVKALRAGTPETITAAVAQCHQAAGARFVVGAGCEVPRDTAAANLLAMRDYARSHSP